MKNIKVGIVGYGNLGKAIEKLLQTKQNIKLSAIFSRRKNVKSQFDTEILPMSRIGEFKNEIDILFICVGSYLDCEKVTLKLIKDFDTIDCFDTHVKIPQFFKSLNNAAKENEHIAISAFGWDPGLLSLIRAIFTSINDETKTHTFWGKGVSQGHSETLRNIEGIENAIQFTVPDKLAMLKCKKQINPSIAENKKHKRVCYISLKDGYSKDEIKKTIMSIPNYFSDQKVRIHFADAEKIKKMQQHLNHKGYVFSNFMLDGNKNLMQFGLQIDSNPMFTARIMLLAVNIIEKYRSEKFFGCRNILEIPLTYYFAENSEETVKKFI